MLELIKLHSEQEIHESFPVNHKELAVFLQIESRNIERYIIGERGFFGFTKSTDFYDQIDVNPAGGRPEKIYWLTIRAAKEISMLSEGKRGIDARHYFIQCELEYLKNKFDLPRDYPAALRALAFEVEKTIQLTEQVTVLAPKGEAFDLLMNSGQNVTFEVFSAFLQKNGNKGWGRNRLFAKLREMKVLKTDGQAHNLPYQPYLEQGYFAVIEVMRNEYLQKQTLITPKGQGWLIKLLGLTLKAGE